MSHSLCFSDMLWIGMAPSQQLIFYEATISRDHFIDTIIPVLKKSLSLALKHFPSMSGNLIIHSDYSRKPEVRFTEGDSVSVVFAESTLQDVEFLVGDQSRNCNEFYPLVPELPESRKLGEERMVPILAIQVTLFPGNGMCIGIANEHAIADGKSKFAFVNAWATISKLGEEYEKADDAAFSPIYDRGVLRDLTKKLDDIVWEKLTSNNTDDKDKTKIGVCSPHNTNHDKVCRSFVVSLDELGRLKKVISSCFPETKHISTFSVI